MTSKASKGKREGEGFQSLPHILRFKKNRAIIITLIVGICLIGTFYFLLSPLFPQLTFTDGKTNQVVGAFQIGIGDFFDIHYTHSIHKTLVIERYKIDENYHIVVDQLIYESFGVGMPSSPEEGQRFRQEDGKFIIDNINRVLPFFDLSVGQVVANHQLKIHDESIKLSDMVTPGNWLRIEVKKVPLIRLWKEGIYLDKSKHS
ncbi:DUF1850 domain-containing protein [Bacillus horti]|uniref:DUF1850 domain-containing protein n=1 Tax=Caldalkalibacillus horti TaxID=77523 RepID=A0ABT9VU67_9BACI|nr:DUF1850 domain-containing protein [Bacillus horti]MDQ0164519.1 hypothetical protein [Bacillus horti]